MVGNNELEHIYRRIEHRMNKRLERLFEPISLLLKNVDYYVAGNSCNSAAPNDYDIYPIQENWNFDFDEIEKTASKMDIPVVSRTRNALTVVINGTPIQFCGYLKASLLELISSFDFAHVQIGIRVHNVCSKGAYDHSTIEEVCTTQNWVESRLLDTTWYVSSEYPLSSLMRIIKYVNRGTFSGRSYIPSLIDIVRDIVNRGYLNYEDFKDQLSAIDLELLETEEIGSARNLYDTFCQKGLVMDPRME